MSIYSTPWRSDPLARGVNWPRPRRYISNTGNAILLHPPSGFPLMFVCIWQYFKQNHVQEIIHCFQCCVLDRFIIQQASSNLLHGPQTFSILFPSLHSHSSPPSNITCPLLRLKPSLHSSSLSPLYNSSRCSSSLNYVHSTSYLDGSSHRHRSQSRSPGRSTRPHRLQPVDPRKAPSPNLERQYPRCQ